MPYNGNKELKHVLIKGFGVLFLTAILIPVCESAPRATSYIMAGNFSYTLHQESNPTADQLDAYEKITAAMDSAIWYYNTYTSITKELNVYYNTSVSTADANINGTIRFGSNRSYMVTCTAMHEIAHTVGVGTHSRWNEFMVEGIFTGTNATQTLREITGDPDAVLHGDTQHFWPYGLNYASEVESEEDLINHCKIVDAIYRDLNSITGIVNLSFNTNIDFSLNENAGIVFTCNIASPCFVELSIYTISGRKLVIYEKEITTAGKHKIHFNNHNLPKGFYVYRFKAGEYQENHSLMLIK